MAVVRLVTKVNLMTQGVSLKTRRSEWLKNRKVCFLKRIIKQSLPLSSIIILGVAFSTNGFSYVLDNSFKLISLVLIGAGINDFIIYFLNDWFYIRNNTLLGRRKK